MTQMKETEPNIMSYMLTWQRFFYTVIYRDITVDIVCQTIIEYRVTKTPAREYNSKIPILVSRIILPRGLIYLKISSDDPLNA